ncbi:MAG: DUF192 domain-containing protein [bacterium]
MSGRSSALAAARYAASFALALALIACNRSTSCDSDQPSVLSFASAKMRVITAADTLRILTELARTSEQQTLGLMERKCLADTAGMLFVYAKDQPASAGFWMFRTLIPLDIAFMDSTGGIRAIQHMVPCTATLVQGCQSYDPGVPYRAAVEMNAGYFSQHRVVLGDRMLLADTSRLVKGISPR